MTEDQIKHMVNRFLCWRLPKDFNPDCGISFDRKYQDDHSPTGTNMFDATQADAMVRHMIEGMPGQPQPDYSHEDCSGWSGPAQHNPYRRHNPYE